MIQRRYLAAAFCAALTSFAGQPMAYAADPFPVRPVKILVGFAPGGSSDTVARILLPRLSEALKQSVIIDNPVSYTHLTLPTICSV